jgi:hypothetical protein
MGAVAVLSIMAAAGVIDMDVITVVDLRIPLKAATQTM